MKTRAPGLSPLSFRPLGPTAQRPLDPVRPAPTRDHFGASPAQPARTTETLLSNTGFALGAAGRPVTYPPGTSRHDALVGQALDLLAGPYSQRARRDARGATQTTGRPQYQEVMSVIDRGPLSELTKSIETRLRATAAAAGQLPTGGLAHLGQIRPEWVATLAPWEQSLVINQHGFNPYPDWMSLGSNLRNNVSMALHDAMDAEGYPVRSQVEASLGAFGKQILDAAEAAWAAKNPAQQHWASGERSPFEPEVRPLTRHELLQLKRVDPALTQEIVKTAPVPRSLPALDAVAEPLADVNLLMIQHQLGSLVPLVDALIAGGIKPENMTLAPVPYSTSAIVQAHVEARGVAVQDTAQLFGTSPKDVERTMEQDALWALSRTLTRAAQNGKPVAVIDDGGLIVRLLSGRAKYVSGPEYDRVRAQAATLPIRIVEQTTRGITEALSVTLPPNLTIVDMARSKAKAQEGPFVGEIAATKLDEQLRNAGESGVAGKKIGVIGFGVIGLSMARALSEAGASVTVYDLNPAERERARALGFEVAETLQTLLPGKGVIVGCSGHRSVSRDDFFSMDDGTFLASVSSKAMEFFTDHVQGSISLNPTPVGNQHHEHATVADHHLSHHKTHLIVEQNPNDDFDQVIYHLLNNGCPINFDGNVNCVPPELIQLTEAIKFQALAQALKSPAGLGLVPLEEARGDRAIAAMDATTPGWRSPT